MAFITEVTHAVISVQFQTFKFLVVFQYEQGVGHNTSDGLCCGERIGTALKQLTTIQVGIYQFTTGHSSPKSFQSQKAVKFSATEDKSAFSTKARGQPDKLLLISWHPTFVQILTNLYRFLAFPGLLSSAPHIAVPKGKACVSLLTSMCGIISL